MLRPQPLRAAAARAAPTRLLSTSRTSLQADPNPSPAWPLLQRRSRSEHSISVAETASPSPKEVSHSEPEPEPEAVATTTATGAPKKTHDARLMLILKGLSPSLNASDFYRLAPSDLLSWQTVITKIQQQRDPTTLEPNGQYNISFGNSIAAISYHDRLLRLHRLSHYRLENVHGLWESTVPTHLQSGAKDDPVSELEAFTVTSGSASKTSVEMTRRRVAVTHKWQKGLEEMTRGLGYGEKPPVVLVRVYPPNLTARELERGIREDGVARGCAWEVSPPQDLDQTLQRASASSSAPRKAEEMGGDDGAKHQISHSARKAMQAQKYSQGRFVVACANDAEARRFQRRWNQSMLPAGKNTMMESRNVVHASIINW
ncbi:hypothetical protein E4U17_002393 [Claviceps sp. LM77 group G4]|nr:hypothetical protein E4U17_002393 [Claviceps sp. LM77 group G4]KAG6077319.1 hypothetical protein E4U33_001346 [Claviceps sp. LM78 group G4]KAG6082329.1 hypothetical protein E4U16_006275 [Claviceps sp. LM84 group G4]